MYKPKGMRKNPHENTSGIYPGVRALNDSYMEREHTKEEIAEANAIIQRFCDWEDGAGAMLEALANWLEDLPTDGWDKRHFYHRELARRLRRGEG